MGSENLLDALREGPTRRSGDVAAAQRRRMLAAMVAAVAEKGYVAVVVADVITRARVSRATFYEQFADKADCFIAAFHACVDQMVRGLRTSIDRAGTPAERLRNLLTSYLDELAAFPEGARVCLVDMYAAGPDAALHRRQIQLDFVALMESVHRAFARDGAAVRELDRLELELIVGAISAVATGRVAAGETANLPELAGPLERFVLTQFGLPPDG